MSSLPVDRRWRLALLAILGTALVLRLISACSLQYMLDYRWHREFLIEGDAEGYWLLAQSIAAGQDYAVYSPPRYALRMPGFPAVLAVSVAAFGPSLFAARLMLACIGAFGCWLVYRLGKVVFNERIGVIASGIAAISPTLILFSSVVLCETVFAVALLWSLLSGQHLYRALDDTLNSGSKLKWNRITGWAVITGIAIAAGVYLKPSWILAAPIVAVLLVLTVRSGRRFAAFLSGIVVIAAMVLALLPWGIRNQQVTGHFTLTTFWMGPSLYDGLNPHATGDSDMRFFDQDGLTKTLGEYEVDQHYRNEAKEFARENPGTVAKLAVVKAWRYWKPWPNAEQFSHPIAAMGVLVFAVPTLLFALFGAISVFKRTVPSGPVFDGEYTGKTVPQRCIIWTVSFLTGPIFYFAALHMVFVSSLRYRLPAEYPLFVLTAVGIAWLLKWTKRSELPA
ncbi:ArnT family glycosyltransferase [Planctomicrobium sp. SH527]|uniref:ArnT family glycosyltransferase n=1 Tax=Planctomicrobium sp. SH527 TaxID=3448123 RepID=UPI003F5C24A1